MFVYVRKFRENCQEYEDSVHQNSISVKIVNQIRNFCEVDSHRCSSRFDYIRRASDDL